MTPRSKRSRTALAAGVGLFLAGQALFNVAVLREWLPVRDPVFAEKFDLLRPHAGFFPAPEPAPQPVPVRVMALGSSRTQLAFDAARYSEHVPGADAFNYGCPAAGPMTAALYLRRLLEKGVRPDVIFVEVHPGFITPRDPPFESQWLHPYRLRPDEIALLRGYGWDVASPRHHGWTGYVTAASAYRMSLLNRYAPVMLPCPFGLTIGARSDPRGYVKGVEVKPAQRASVLRRSFEQYAPALADYHVGGPGCAALRDTLTLCKQHGIRAAVVLMPESSEFRGWYGAGYPAVGAFTESLGREFGVPVIDAREWVPDDQFSDGHHLIPAGARTFTDRLAVANGRWSVVREGKKEGRR